VAYTLVGRDDLAAAAAAYATSPSGGDAHLHDFRMRSVPGYNGDDSGEGDEYGDESGDGSGSGAGAGSSGGGGGGEGGGSGGGGGGGVGGGAGGADGEGDGTELEPDGRAVRCTQVDPGLISLGFSAWG